MNAFEKFFEECCMESRSWRIVEEMQENVEYAQGKVRCEQLYLQIKNCLGKREPLIEDYDESKNYLASLTEEEVYLQGVQDSIFLLRWLGIISF